MICEEFDSTNGSILVIVTKSTKGDTYTLFANLVSQFKESIDNIQKIDDQPYLHETLITLLTVTKALPPLYFNQNVLSTWLKEEQRELAVLVWKNQNPEQFAQLEQEKAELEKQLLDYEIQYKQSAEVAKVNEFKNTIAEKKLNLANYQVLNLWAKREKLLKLKLTKPILL